MSKYLGNNYWLLDDGRLLNTLRSTIIDEPLSIFKYNKSVGNHEVYEDMDFNNMQEGKQFVMFDFCSKVERRKATLYVSFLKFNTIDMTNRKFGNKWVNFNHQFLPERAYVLFCEIDNDYPDRIKIIKIKEL